MRSGHYRTWSIGVNPVPRVCTHGFGTRAILTVFWTEAYAWVVLSYDLPVRPIRRAHGPEALEGEAPLGLSSGRRLDRRFGVKGRRGRLDASGLGESRDDALSSG